MALRFTNFFNPVVLTASSSRSLRQSLADYRTCAEAEYAGLLEESGTVLMESGTLPKDQSPIIGALANGAFIAVRELASRLGDDCCEGLYHQGRTKHFSIVPLSPVTTLITVFGNETKLGIVRSAVARYGPQLRDLLDDSTLGTTNYPVQVPQDGDLVLSGRPEEVPPPALAASAPSMASFFQENTPTPPAPTPMEVSVPVLAAASTEPELGSEAVVFSPFLPLPPLQSAGSNGSHGYELPK